MSRAYLVPNRVTMAREVLELTPTMPGTAPTPRPLKPGWKASPASARYSASS